MTKLVFSDFLYCLWFSKQNNCNLLSIFNETFLNEKTIGQPKEELPFFFNRCIQQIEVNDKFIFLLVNNSVMLMDRSNGTIFQTVKINTDSFFLMDKFILTYKKTNLIFYDFEGKFCTNVIYLPMKLI
jgi:hypothetical protein